MVCDDTMPTAGYAVLKGDMFILLDKFFVF